MKLIETDITLQSLTDIKLLVPIWSSPKGHELASNISFFYYKTKSDEDGIININHIDADKCDIQLVYSLITEDTLVLGNRYMRGLGTDYEWVYFEEYGVPFDIKDFCNRLYSTHRTDFNELNDCIPIMKWYEILSTMLVPEIGKDWYKRYSDSITTLGRLEGAGVLVDVEKFTNSYNFPVQYIHSGIVYTKYNPYTITGRPTNRHLGVNWSAMPKDDRTRECVISRWEGGSLLQFDYESYHIRLIARMIAYPLPTETSAHQYFADIYGTDYETAKGITFRYLYGGLDERAESIPFFQRVAAFIRDQYRLFISTGKLKTPIMGREIPFQRIEGGGEQKVFNYLLQATETELNYTKLREMMDWFEGKQSKPILYTYDAFLIDVHPAERDEIRKTLPTMLERGGFPVRTYEGKNYDGLEPLS